ncbi:putative CyaI3 adenylate/guanylate cyclase [Nitrospira moscoviensis]|uniref:Putative CyaI3 adenylate/guanylate cyclase n=1 Tax=Nitrospira moscoviensis TaxID=42253 RepID=A0A0K2GIJ1_NITMO|nr:putative CyaI3 adenylate/guanylate cyclase [Nitrospira moscoviensis]
MDGERRHLTVMFCDLAGSTMLSAKLDPEDMHDVLRAYQEHCAGAIQLFDGHIAQYLGDGVLAYFGYPMAHEDDAKRAVHAGLRIVGGMEQLNAKLSRDKGVTIAVRIGIHTGLVVVGDIGAVGKQERLALGEAPNVAARLQGMAEPNGLVVSEATYGLIEGFFRCRDAGVHALAGLDVPMRVYRVVEESDARSRLDVAVALGRFGHIVGREREVTALIASWRRVTAGRSQVVTLSGEAGIGKSRLVQALKEHLSEEPHRWIEWRCSSYFQHSALHPVIEYLQRLAALKRDDAPVEKLRKLEAALEATPMSAPDSLPLIASLLSIPFQDRYPPLNLSPQRQKQKTLDVVAGWIGAIARRTGTVLVVEDLHWIDPTSQELLALLLKQSAAHAILILLTFRPEYHGSWPSECPVTPLTLTRLAPNEVLSVVQRVAGGRNLPASVLRQLIAKTDGIPLFVEEMTKTVLESGSLTESEGQYELSDSLSSLGIPATLNDSLMARLDRLATIKEVAQLGAMLGREFSYELITAVSFLNEGILHRELERLVDAELLVRQGDPPHAIYSFRHALLQDAAYESLLKSRRQQLHQRVASVLEIRFPETVETQPELLASHYTGAGSKKEAIAYWLKAGQRAIGRSANAEAVAHITKGLELLRTFPESPERTQQELQLQVALGTPLLMTKGYGAPQVVQTYSRARELCRELGDTIQVFPILIGLWLFYHVRAELLSAKQLGEELLTLAERAGDSASLVQAHMAIGDSLYYLGELSPARAHLEQSCRLYQPDQHRSFALRYAHDPGVFTLNVLAFVLWFLGFADQAVEKNRKALALASELKQPSNFVHCLHNASALSQLRGEPQLTLERSERQMKVSEEQGFVLWFALGMFYRGWALANLGQHGEGVALMKKGLASYRATGAELGHSYCLTLLAETCLATGDIEEGHDFIAQAAEAANRHNDRFYASELYRVRGELLLKKSIAGERDPEHWFLMAVDVARQQQAKSLELKAASSLSRLWHSRGQRKEAHAALASISGWFQEGGDTRNVREAKALLEKIRLGNGDACERAYASEQGG